MLGVRVRVMVMVVGMVMVSVRVMVMVVGMVMVRLRVMARVSVSDPTSTMYSYIFR